MPAAPRIARPASAAARRKPTGRFALLGMALALLISGALFFVTRGRVGLIWSWLAAVSAVTFVAYGYDKVQAKRDGGRVPEIVLHGLALVGGFLGGWAGRALFRHKTRKPIFTVVLALSSVAYLGLGWYLLRVR